MSPAGNLGGGNGGSSSTNATLTAVRDDSLSTLGTAEGADAGLRVDSLGALWTRTYASITDFPGIDRTLDSISAAVATDRVMDDQTPVTPAFAVVHHNTSGNNTIVNADATKKIRVFACFLVAATAVTVRFEGGADGTALTGQMQLAANSGFVLPFNPVGWFETAANTLLNLELSSAVYVDGSVVYGLI